MARQLEQCNFAFHTKQAKTMTAEALAYTIKDCKEAAEIHDEMDRQGIPNNSGRYWDEYHTYCQEVSRRKAKEAKNVRATV